MSSATMTITCLEKQQQHLKKHGFTRAWSLVTPPFFTTTTSAAACCSTSTSFYYLLVLLLAVFALPVYKQLGQHGAVLSVSSSSSLSLSAEPGGFVDAQRPSQPLAPLLVHKAVHEVVTTEPPVAMTTTPDIAPAHCPLGGWLDKDGTHWPCHIYYSRLGLYHFTRYTNNGLGSCPPGTVSLPFFFGQRTACASPGALSDRSCSPEERHHWEQVICHPSREACLAPRVAATDNTAPPSALFF